MLELNCAGTEVHISTCLFNAAHAFAVSYCTDTKIATFDIISDIISWYLGIKVSSHTNFTPRLCERGRPTIQPEKQVESLPQLLLRKGMRAIHTCTKWLDLAARRGKNVFVVSGFSTPFWLWSQISSSELLLESILYYSYLGLYHLSLLP